MVWLLCGKVELTADRIANKQCYWAMQPGDDEATWGPDAKLTPQGIQEAKLKGAIWRKHIADGAPIPERHFVSPLSRSIRTMEETWKDIYGWLGSAPHPRAPRGVKPVVTEVSPISYQTIQISIPSPC